MAQIRKVTSKSDWDRFIGMVWDIYRDDPAWVPPLRIAVKDQLSEKKNPFFKHAEMLPLIAVNDAGKVVGRIVGVVDRNHNKFHEEKSTMFGFFECVDDQAVANQLLDAVAAWGREMGMNNLRGPMNLSMNNECGLLIDGFQNPPAVLMTYNPPYYAKLMETWGLAKTKDMYAYELDKATVNFSERILKHADKLMHDNSVVIRSIRMDKFDEEVNKALEIYNNSWEKNWGFVPLDEDEIKYLVKELKMIVDPNLVLFAEVGGQLAGFAVALPDVNQVFKKIPNGKLMPTGLVKLLWNLKGPGRRKTINRIRIWALGVKREFMPIGLGPLLYMEYVRRGPSNGYPIGECSWILEDNVPMNKALEGMRATKTKTYRIYDRPLQATT